jgi:hypothetical protein
MTTHKINPPTSGVPVVTLCCGKSQQEVPASDIFTWGESSDCAAAVGLRGDELIAAANRLAITDRISSEPVVAMLTRVTGALEDEKRMRRMDTDHVRDLEEKIAAVDAGFQQLHFACSNPDHAEAYQSIAAALGYAQEES